MRFHSALMLLCLAALSGCAALSSQEPFEHCIIDPKEGWKLIPTPHNSAELLAIPSRHGSIGNELELQNSGHTIHEHWFQRSPDEIAACRHLVVRDACDEVSATAQFVKREGEWAAPDEAMVSVCVTVTETHDASLEPLRRRLGAKLDSLQSQRSTQSPDPGR